MRVKKKRGKECKEKDGKGQRQRKRGSVESVFHAMLCAHSNPSARCDAWERAYDARGGTGGTGGVVRAPAHVSVESFGRVGVGVQDSEANILCRKRSCYTGLNVNCG